MASFQQISEEGRPPESPNRKYFNRKLRSTPSIAGWPGTAPKRSYLTENAVNLSDKNIPEFNNNHLFDVVMQDFNRNKTEKSSLKQTLPKLLCLKKPASASGERSERNSFKTLNVNALRTRDNFSWTEYYGAASKSLDNPDGGRNNCDKSEATSSHDGDFNGKCDKRKSFYQNVEDALNSILWQPYEYQNTSRTTSVSPSSCSSPSSSINDLDEIIITKNDSDGGIVTATTATTPRRCSFTDLHLTSEMVINLTAESTISDQWKVEAASRDPHAPRPYGLLSNVVLSQAERFDSDRSSILCDENGTVDMQVNVSLSAPVQQTSVLNIGTAASQDNGLRNNNATVGNPSESQQSVLFSNNLNLSSANVVGLPNHTRYASVPVSTIQNRSNTVFPNHARNVSEPTNHFMRQNNPSTSGGQQIQQTNSQYHRHSTPLDQTNFQQINHLRSSSVPKSLAIVPRHDSNTTTTTTTVPSPHINNSYRFNQKVNYPIEANTSNGISNVNVNFYRSAPVNVVSSVPTITCLNNLSNVHGNEVSNVQVLPLNSNTNSFNASNNSQVILHNTQPSSSSVQIAQRNNMFDPQIVPVQPGKVTANYVSNNCLSPLSNTLNNNNNQVVIHNTRPVSNNNNTMSPVVQKMYTNNVQDAASQNRLNVNRSDARTFTSTEAQTDDISVLPAMNNDNNTSVNNREQRRRERRERRHQRRSGTQRQCVENSTQVNHFQQHNDRLPDLLNSHHLPPPYSVLPHNQPPPQHVIGPMPPPPPPAMVPPPPQMLPPPPHGAVLQSVVPNNIVSPSGFVFPPPPPVVPGQVPMVQGPTPVAVPVPPPSGFRFPFPTNGFRRSRFTEDSPKGCCGLLSWKPGSLRWFIALIALVAVCCVLVGTALGAMRPAGRDHLTVSLLMIGVGIVLVTVSGVAWRLTSHDSSTCRSMLGLGSTESVDACARRFVPRLPPSYGRPHHPYAAMMYPEFQYRPPPPSYQASMQEYRLRLLLLDRGNTPQIQAGIQNAVSPPPTYRSHAGSLLRAPLSSRRDASQSEYSCPPSYRSQNSTNRQGAIASNSVLHSREESLSLSESNHGGSVVNVVNILGSTAEDIALDNITLDSLKMEPESDINPVKMLLKGNSSDLDGSKDGNLVTIVQTSDQSPVIVTVSGSPQINNSNSNSVQITEIPSEMEILAHL